MKMLPVLAAAVLAPLALATPDVARADDFIALCKVGNPIDGADKICQCVSDKTTGADRTAAIEIMKITNDALAKGGAGLANMTPAQTQAMTKLATVEAACMQ